MSSSSTANRPVPMESTAWKSARFDYPSAVPAMISTTEKQYLYWLAANVWQGRGAIVEIGPWLGGSTVCLAAGMQAYGHATTRRLFVFDNFIWREFMAERAELPVQSGESFEPWFRENLASYAELLSVHRRTLPDETIQNDELASSIRYQDHEQIPLLEELPVPEGQSAPGIEILFIDGAKSWCGIKHLLLTLGSRLLPDSLLVCQDFKHWGAYWVPLMMSQIRGHLESIHNVADATTITFRVKSPIPLEKIQAFPDHVRDLPTAASLQMINDIAEELFGNGDDLGCWTVPLGGTRFLGHQNKIDEAVSVFKSIQRNWPANLNASQLDQARNYLANEHNVSIRRPPGMQLRRIARYCKRKLSGG